MGQLITVRGDSVEYSSRVSWPLRRGGIVCMATDTVYGLHCSAGLRNQPRARALKGRVQAVHTFVRPAGLALVAEVRVRAGVQDRIRAAHAGVQASPRTPRWLLGQGTANAVRCPRTAVRRC
jgi:tRNA A37 threonylcarbamoyladenosine synthetase subunit TsaC/SUA5/YrdC